MAHQLKLQNVTKYITDTGNSGSKYYGIIAQNQDTEPKNILTLGNSDYVMRAIDHGGDPVEAMRTFNCGFYNINNKDDYVSKKIFHTNGLKLDGAVQYDAENHIFTATVAQDQSFVIEFPNSEYYINSLNHLVNNPSYLSSLLGE